MSDKSTYSKEELDNHSNQLNSNNDAYWKSRGEAGRPDDWDDMDTNNTNNSNDDWNDWDDDQLMDDWCEGFDWAD